MDTAKHAAVSCRKEKNPQKMYLKKGKLAERQARGKKKGVKINTLPLPIISQTQIGFLVLLTDAIFLILHTAFLKKISFGAKKRR